MTGNVITKCAVQKAVKENEMVGVTTKLKNVMEQGTKITSEITSAYLLKEGMKKQAIADVADKVPSTVSAFGEMSYRCLELCEEKERPKIITDTVKVVTETILGGTFIICGASVTKTCLMQHGKTSRHRQRCKTVSSFSLKELVTAIRK